MIRKVFLLLYLFVATLSCSSDKIPSGILPPQKMEAVLWDMFRAGNYVTTQLIPADSTLKREPEQIKWFNRVLTIHQVSEKQFKSSLAYYRSRPDLLATMMDSMSKKGEVPSRKPTEVIKAVQ